MRIGNWEANTIIGQHHKQAIVAIVENHTGLLKMKRMAKKSASQVSDAMINLLITMEIRAKTITSDNVREFADHKKVRQKLFSSFFFTDVYESWQRGMNQNTNSLIR